MTRISLIRVGMIIVAGLGNSAYATPATDLFSAKVKVDVSADASIHSQIESFLEPELRSLNDVLISDEAVEWVVQIVALELVTEGAMRRGLRFLQSSTRQWTMNFFSGRYLTEATSSTSHRRNCSSSQFRAGSPSWKLIGYELGRQATYEQFAESL